MNLADLMRKLDEEDRRAMASRVEEMTRRSIERGRKWAKEKGCLVSFEKAWGISPQELN